MNEDDKFISANMLSIHMVNARKGKKMSQEELSNLSGLSKSTISDLENIGNDKNPTINSVLSYLSAIGCTLVVRKIKDCEDEIADEKDDDKI